MRAMTSRDRRALGIGAAILLPALLYVWGVQPFLASLADTLVVEGVAETSGDVFDALGEARTLANVRVVAPVRRDFRSGNDASEHFTIGARVVGVEPTPKAVVKRAPTPPGARP